MRRAHDSHHPDRALCRISYWQGYVTGRYYAYAGDPSTPLLCSAAFRTWTWRNGNGGPWPDSGEAARAAFDRLVRELHALGWQVADTGIGAHAVTPEEPEVISRETVLSALGRISGDDGATAAEVGREVLGDEASLVEHLPLRVGAELRRLQLQGKVERRENAGPPRWFLTASAP
jgi:hypothetical protein